MDIEHFVRMVRHYIETEEQNPNIVSKLSDYEIGVWWFYLSGFLTIPPNNAPNVPFGEFTPATLMQARSLAEKVEKETFRRDVEREPYTRADFEFSITNALQDRAKKEANKYRIVVSGHRSRMNDNEFSIYWNTEREKLINDPMLPKLDKLKAEFGSLEKHISTIAERLENNLLPPINWKALRFEKSAMWHKGIITWREGLSIEVKLTVLNEFRFFRPGMVPLRRAFSALFINEEAAYKALEAALNAGIIDETGNGILGKRKIVAAIIQFWEAVSDPKFNLTHIRALKEAITETYLQPCAAIAEQFGASIGKSAINEHAGNRRGTYFTAVARAIGGK